MNKDKIIKDLKERNDKLKNQYQLQEIRLHSLENKYSNLKTALDESQEVVISYKEENEKYKKILDKIKEKLQNELDNYNVTMGRAEKIELLELLEEIE